MQNADSHNSPVLPGRDSHVAKRGEVSGGNSKVGGARGQRVLVRGYHTHADGGEVGVERVVAVGDVVEGAVLLHVGRGHQAAPLAHRTG